MSLDGSEWCVQGPHDHLSQSVTTNGKRRSHLANPLNWLFVILVQLIVISSSDLIHGALRVNILVVAIT